MDHHQSGRLWVLHLPRGPFWTIVIALFWYPVYESLHQGQITLVLTALLAAALERTPFTRGILLGFVTAIKPVFVLLLPFGGLLFGWRCVVGMLIGLLPAMMAWPWFVEYVILFPKIMNNNFASPSPAGILGAVPSAIVSCIINLFIVWKVECKEWAYLLNVGVVSIFTALWIHSYTPVILPIIFYLNKRMVNESTIVNEKI